MTKGKLPISAIVTTKNEGHLLLDCLRSIQFCDEIVVIDLSSTDNSVNISREWATEVITIDPLPNVETVHHFWIKKLKYDWVYITDPDERAPKSVSKYLKNHFKSFSADKKLGVVNFPFFNYFGNKRLNGTPWGGLKWRTTVVNRKGFEFVPVIHNGRILKKGFENRNVNLPNDDHIVHLWMHGTRQLVTKHKKYLVSEGESRYRNGQRASLMSIIRAPFYCFLDSFIHERAYRDGIIGFFLSLFWSWYQTLATYKLYRYQSKATTS